jgi:hypothetical protein
MTLTDDEKDLITEEFVTALFNEIAIEGALKKKSNAEIADLVLNHLWADTVVGSPQSALLNEVTERLRGENREVQQ